MTKGKGKLVRLTNAEASVVRVVRRCVAELPDPDKAEFVFGAVGGIDLREVDGSQCPEMTVQSGITWGRKPPEMVQAMAARAVSMNAKEHEDSTLRVLPDDVEDYVKTGGYAVPVGEVH